MRPKALNPSAFFIAALFAFTGCVDSDDSGAPNTGGQGGSGDGGGEGTGGGWREAVCEPGYHRETLVDEEGQQSIQASDTESDLQLCGDTWVRESAGDCTVQPSTTACTTGDGDCADASDCTERPSGDCNEFWDGCRCVYSCDSDASCESDEACLCPTAAPVSETGWNVLPLSFGKCLPANCRDSSDCDGEECVVSPGCCEPAGAFCQTKDDECKTNLDCEGSAPGDWCTFDEAEERWVCKASECACE